MPMNIASMPGFSTSTFPFRNSCRDAATIAFLLHIKVSRLKVGTRAMLNMFTLWTLEVVGNLFNFVSIFLFSNAHALLCLSFYFVSPV
jgi:hypothetical protein